MSIRKFKQGLLQNGDMIAVKKLTSTLPGIKDRQFDNEAQHLMRLSHPNIVQLVGYCSHTEEILVQHKGRYVYAEKSEKLLCLEYLPKGSLHEHLSDESSGLDWDMRFKIIEGICNGLHYLHEKWQASTPIIHMDLKPKNILLDDNMMPKIADFGLSRLFGEEQTRTCTANRDGTLGYMAPEYLNRGIITKKLDIFSLGVIIIEIITGNKDYPDETETSSQEFIELVLKNWRNRLGKAPRYTAAFSIFPSFCREQIRRCIQIGLACVKLNRVKRPTTLEILSMLHKSEGAECSNGKEAQNDGYTDQSVRYPLLKQSSSDIFKIEPDGLKKFDSFSRWMNNELPEVADLDINSSSDAFWSTTETVNVADGSSIPINEQLDAFVVSPSLSQDQLFSIIDVSPSWAYNGTKTKVLIVGTFLAKNEDVENCRWSCMFGDVEVSAEVLVDGSLRCYTPVHHSGRVPFYVTCSNRVACSEVREFEFRGSEAHYMETSDQHTTDINEMHLHIRLDKLLSLEPEDYEKYVLNNGNKSELIDTISSLMLDDKLSSLTLPSDEKELSTLRDQNLEKQVKEKLYYWLIHKIHDDEKGPNDQGKEGQGVIHLVAALGYDWAIKPIVAAGVNINLDIRGWSALHWAASCGRERTVGALIANGASPGALTDPTQLYPSGRTPADLASENGHKGIAGFLAESALTSHLSALTLKESQGGNVEEVCGLSDEYTLSLVSLRNPKSGHSDLHSAAVHIQNKFRGWKGRLEFMIIRQRIVKIQAHIRGHQVRKNYRKIVWSVGIVEKVIQRWRRKRRDLRGFQPEKQVGGPSWQIRPSKAENEDEYDCLMLKRALAHVRSMQQYPEARDQYRRLQDCVNRLQESQAMQDRMLADAAAPDGDDFMAELEKTSVVLPHPHLNGPSCL